MGCCEDPKANQGQEGTQQGRGGLGVWEWLVRKTVGCGGDPSEGELGRKGWEGEACGKQAEGCLVCLRLSEEIEN